FKAMNALDDSAMFAKLLALFPMADADKSALYSAALRGAFLLLLHKEEISTDRFDDMLRLLIRGIILQMFGE
ncbi:MAG: TetR/AcrR family transcriptional regulator, partial [Bacillota bacterium]